MYIIIVGASKIGQTLASLLIGEKHNVVVVEKDEAKARKLADIMDAVIINGSGTEIDVLNEAGAEKADVIVPATSDDAVNLMVCELAKILGIQRRITLSTNPKHEQIFHEVGVEHIIYPSGTISNHLKNLILRPGISNLLLGNGETSANIVEIIIPKDSESVGKMIRDLGLPEDTIIAGIHRNGQLTIPGGKTVLEAGDKLTVLGKPEYIDRVSEILRK
jgi:trk system potassium uptake protein TrkA